MKLSEYMPQVPQMVQQMSDLNNQINMFQLMKSAGETSKTPTIGLDHIVNTWVRHQMAYRQQLVMDLQTVAMSVEEIRGPLSHITTEVFRRGLDVVPKVENPDMEQKEKLQEWFEDCNVFDQSFEEVLRQFHFDVNSLDDGFIYLAKEYKDLGDKTVRSRITEIRRLNPALVEFDLDTQGLPKNAHFICPIHRDNATETSGPCSQDDCELQKLPAMYTYYHRNNRMYLLDNEIVHLSKFSPSETYGWSPILTIFEKALTLIGMDKNLYRYFFERKMPAAMVMVTTDDPESLRREREHIAAQTRLDPNYIPMVAVSSRGQRGRVDMVRLFHTLQEMDYLPVREEIRERVAAMWGVTPAWQGAPEAFGGLSTQTQQLVVMSRVVESDQRLFHEKIFPQILRGMGITDWEIHLPNPEEKAESTRLSMAQQKVQIVSQFAQLGFDVELKQENVGLDEAEFIISGSPVPTAQMNGEQMAMQLNQQKEQMEMQEEQQAMQGAEGAADEMVPEGAEGGEEPIQAMLKSTPLRKTIPRSQRKFKGRTGGRTPDWHDKAPNEERDIDEYAEARANKNSLTLMDSLNAKGYMSPEIKEVTPDMSKMWFSQSGIDYVATLSPQGVVDVNKATFPEIPKRKQTPIASTPAPIEDDDADY